MPVTITPTKTQVGVSIRKMSLRKGDIIHVNVASGTPTHKMQELADDLTLIAQEHDVFFMIGDMVESLSKVSDTKMKKLGWVRK